MKLGPLLDARIEREFSLWDLLRWRVAYAVLGHDLATRIGLLIMDLERLEAEP